MSGITDPSEEYFKDGLWAWVTDQWKKLIGDDAGHLQVDVVESGLPTGAATSANQTTMITALQLIDDLRAALNSIATDELDVVIDGQTVDVEIKQTTAADLTPGVMGWDGSAWRKLPLMWGYSERWAETQTDTAAGVEDVYAVTATISAGYVYVLQAASAYHNAAAAKWVRIFLHHADAETALVGDTTAAGNVPIKWSGNVILAPGDTVRAFAITPGAGKTITLYVWGYKMKVAE